MKLFNSLTKKKEEFKPIKKGEVSMYSCGPTVYFDQHIGHMYAYVQWDALVRTFKYLGNKVKWVMNITDVGHMTSDEDEGEDKMEKGAKREGLTVWQVAEKYTRQFEESMELLNIEKPGVLSRVTDNIEEQIEMIKKIEANGFTYKTKTGLVFDTGKFPDYAKFANLKLEKQKAGARTEVDEEKKQPWDFLLWVTNQPKHVMQWDSPWGKGFPGWHIECTAISTKYLGEKFDVHTGGKEHVSVHHTNEIAQGYGAMGKQTANYWLHNEWLMIDKEKMSKSLGNNVLATDLVKKGIDPLALRYLVLTSHYRSGLNFTFKALEAAETALKRLRKRVGELNKGEETVEMGKLSDQWNTGFKDALEDDLDTPKALSLVWEMMKDEKLKNEEKFNLIKVWDEVLGLSLIGKKGSSNKEEVREERVDDEVLRMVEERTRLRKERSWEEADLLRKKIEEKGYTVEDVGERTSLIRK
jgi:cysteinyl-tRNA synthetase